MSCKCYKSVTKPHTYIKCDGQAYWSITPMGKNFSLSYFGSPFTNRLREVYVEVDEREVDDIFDDYLSKKTDIDIAHQRAKPNKRITACLEQAKSKFI